MTAQDVFFFIISSKDSKVLYSRIFGINIGRSVLSFSDTKRLGNIPLFWCAYWLGNHGDVMELSLPALFDRDGKKELVTISGEHRFLFLNTATQGQRDTESITISLLNSLKNCVACKMFHHTVLSI